MAVGIMLTSDSPQPTTSSHHSYISSSQEKTCATMLALTITQTATTRNPSIRSQLFGWLRLAVIGEGVSGCEKSLP